MAKRRQSAHEQLDALRATAAQARIQARDLQAQIEQAEQDAARAAQAIVEGHADEDPQAVAQAREAEDHAVSLGHDLVARFAGAQIRVQRAQQDVDNYLRDHAQGLLTERVEEADRVTKDLTASVRETLRLHKALIAERQEQDRIIAGAGHNPRLDSAPATHEWEQALNALAKTVQQHPELSAMTPRWHGRQHTEERDRVHAQLQEQRG